MNLHKTYIIATLLLILLTDKAIEAQTIYSHGVFWGRLVLADKITDKLKWELLLQKRTQNKLPGEGNIFESIHFTSVWFWLNYNLNKNYKLSVSPFGYFDSHLLNIKPGDDTNPGIKEYRWVVRLENEQRYSFLNYYNRYSVEYRRRDLLNDGVYRPNFRIRYMARLEKPVKGILSKEKPLTFILYDEVFLQFGPAVANNPNIFDQNRINIGVNYEVFKNVKVTMSYLNIFVARNSGKEFDNAHCLWVILTFDNLFSQFKRKTENK